MPIDPQLLKDIKFFELYDEEDRRPLPGLSTCRSSKKGRFCFKRENLETSCSSFCRDGSNCFFETAVPVLSHARIGRLHQVRIVSELSVAGG